MSGRPLALGCFINQKGQTAKGKTSFWKLKWMPMKLTAAELDVLHTLWASDRPLSAAELINQSKYKLLKHAIVTLVIDSLLEKKLLVQAGVYQVFSQKQGRQTYSYTAAISFSDYYLERFSTISPRNMFRLTEALLRSKKLNPQMLQELSQLLANRIQEISQSSNES